MQQSIEGGRAGGREGERESEGEDGWKGADVRVEATRAFLLLPWHFP